MFESVYEQILIYELAKYPIQIEKQKPIPVYWDNNCLDIGFRADVIIDNKLIIEIKSIESLHNVHKKQLLTYLRLSNMKLGLLINFNEYKLMEGFCRIANGLSE